MAAIGADLPEVAVTVVYAGKTATGLRGVQIQDTSPDVMGELGISTNKVRVRADQIDLPLRGDTLVVNGENVFCVEARLDDAGANYVIEYSIQQIA